MRPLFFVLPLLLLPGLAVTPAVADGIATAGPSFETPALYDDEGGANGDDPAIWEHPGKPGKSVIVATAKEGGLYVYNLKGQQLQHLLVPAAPGPGDEGGRFNNVDLIKGFRLANGSRTDLAVVSDRGRDHIRFYAIDPAAAAAGQPPLTDVTSSDVPFVFNTTQSEVNEAATAYGLATWQQGHSSYALVSRRHATDVGLARLAAKPDGTVGYTLVRSISLPQSFALPNGATWTPCDDPGDLPQVEGMVVDGENDVLYAAQEDVGIWRMRADLTGAPVLIERNKGYGRQDTFDPATEECVPGTVDPGYGGLHLEADAEGLTIYDAGDGEGYLMASSQGDNTFAVFDREDQEFKGQFRVGAEHGVDGVEVSDGSMVTSSSLGGHFPHGLFVAHDGENTPAEGDREITNFKLVPWEEIAEPLDLDIVN